MANIRSGRRASTAGKACLEHASAATPISIQYIPIVALKLADILTVATNLETMIQAGRRGTHALQLVTEPALGISQDSVIATLGALGGVRAVTGCA